MDFAEMRERALELSQLYDQLNAAHGQSVWDYKDLALGFIGDIGDLMQAVQVAEGKRESSDGIHSIEHELADCLWSVLVLADHFGVDLQRTFGRTMDELEEKILTKIANTEQTRKETIID